MKNRVQQYAQTIADTLPSTGQNILLTVGTAGLYALGVGLNRVFGLGIKPSDVDGIEVLQKVLAFEKEADELGNELGTLLSGKQIPGTESLPAPIKGKKDEPVSLLNKAIMIGAFLGVGYLAYLFFIRK